MWWPEFLLVLVFLFRCGSSITQDVVATFNISENNLGQDRFEHLVVNKYTGQVYLGSGQWVYQLDQNLTCVAKVYLSKTSPCYNKALLIDYTTSRLIACEGIFGRCTVIHLQDNQDIRVQPRNESPDTRIVATTNVEASTVAFISPGPFNTHVMYVGVTYTDTSNTKHPLPGVASRSLESDRMFHFANNNNYSKGTFMFLNKTLKNYIINYVYGTQTNDLKITSSSS
uniref:Plexin-A2 n=1 Tax=Cacopsylla melanoneura TaxID=428564 RepID=A0A8D8QQ25_9HEMI